MGAVFASLDRDDDVLERRHQPGGGRAGQEAGERAHARARTRATRSRSWSARVASGLTCSTAGRSPTCPQGRAGWTSVDARGGGGAAGGQGQDAEAARAAGAQEGRGQRRSRARRKPSHRRRKQECREVRKRPAPAQAAADCPAPGRPSGTAAEPRRRPRLHLPMRPAAIGKREIARAFGLIAPERQAELRALLKELKGKARSRPPGTAGSPQPARLPEQRVVRVTGTDRGRRAPSRGRSSGSADRPAAAGADAAGARGTSRRSAPGERVLARLKPIGGGKVRRPHARAASTEAPGRMLGVFRPEPGGGRIQPTDRRAKAEWRDPAGRGAAAPRQARSCVADPAAAWRAGPQARPRSSSAWAAWATPRSISLICIHAHDIPQEFSAAALPRRRAAPPVALGAREDLRDRAAGHHRRRGRARLRRRGVRRARTRTASACMVAIADVSPLRPARLRAGPRGPRRAATASTSPTASCRCCPRRCRTAGAACARRGARLPVRRAADRRGGTQDRATASAAA